MPEATCQGEGGTGGDADDRACAGRRPEGGGKDGGAEHEGQADIEDLLAL